MTGKRQNAYFRKLLVGYDGSPQSEKAVDVAFSLAECLDATVLIFAVARPPEPSTSVELEACWTTRRNTLKRDSRRSWKRPAGAT
jgi:nucleotide-binding universal stress UspA family protein